MEIKEYKKAVSEIKASEEKKEAIIETLVAQTSSTSKEVKHALTKKHAVMAAFTIVLLCIVIVPISIFFAPSYSPSHNVPSYKLNQLYTREDGNSVTFDSASVSNGLFVDEKQYDGYYLILSGLFDFSSFSFNPQNDVVMFYIQEEQAAPLVFNAELSKTLSPATLFIGDTKGKTNGRLCFVFEMSAEQYNLTTEGTI